MKEIFRWYKENLENLINNKLILLLTFITVALSYGFALTNPSISIDDTAASLYFERGELLAQGRFFPIIVSKILGGMNFTPFWLEFVAILLIILSGLLYLCLFKKVTNDKINKICYVFFIPIFVSYPIINEIFIYNTAVITIGLGYLLTAVATILTYEFIESKKKKPILLVLSILLMAAVISSYESFAPVFLLGMSMILFLQYLYNFNEPRFNKKQWSRYLYIFILVIATAIILEFITTTSYIVLHNITPSKNAGTVIMWLKVGILNNIKPFIKSMLVIVYPISSYLSILILQITSIVLFIFAIIKSFIKKNYWILLFAGFLVLSIFSLSFVQGILSPFRTCQGFAIFIAFVAMIIYDQTPNKIKSIILISIVYLVTIQSYDLTKWFYNDNLRYQEERTVMISVAETIKRDFDAAKPVVFIGEYQQGAIIRHNQTNGNSFINWGKSTFDGPGTQLLKFLEMNGEYLVSPTREQYDIAWKNINNMTRWPKQGSITEYNGIIVVRF